MSSPFKMNSPFKNLNRWFKEEWQTPSGESDYGKGENTFRPTKKISKDTPSTWSELTPAEKSAAKKEKTTKGRVSRYKKKKKE
tara:strand:+ start:546 stop:794 length:249 start_codon:yes stop_codon:yes gene_type:complete